MNIEALRVFITVADLKNFSRAAEQLNFSQPNVSLQIRNLEDTFNEKLINRTPKHVELTKAGQIVYEQARKIISIYDETSDAINELKNVVSGTLKIGASFTIGEYVMPKILAEFASIYPQIEIELNISNTDTINDGVKANKFDIGLIEGSVQYDDLESEPFLDDEMVLIVSPDNPLAKKQIIDPSELNNQTWILRESGSGTRAYSDELINRWELTSKRNYVFSSSQAVKEAVSAGLGIAVLSHLIVAKEIKNGELKVVTIKKNRFERQFSIIYNKGRSFSKAENVFLQKLHEYKEM